MQVNQVISFVKRILVIVNWILLVCAASITLLAAGFFIAKWFFGWNSPRTLYWISLYQPLDMVAAVLVMLPVIGVYLLVVILLFRRPTYERQQTIAGANVVFAVVTFALVCGSQYSILVHTGILGYREHLETVRLTDHVYHLHYYGYDERYTYRYGVYECDSLDILCQQIYSVFRTTGGIEPDVEVIHLLIVENAIALEINGETVHIPEQ